VARKKTLPNTESANLKEEFKYSKTWNEKKVEPIKIVNIRLIFP